MRELLLRGLRELSLAEDIADPLLLYLELMRKWNKAYNLTGVRDPDDMVLIHLLDSLTAVPFVQGAQTLDVGTGAGLPGIPLAIAMPDSYFTLLDSNGKKTRFIEHAIRQLGLQNIDVQKTRIEDYAAGRSFDTIVSRAFSSLNDFVSACEPYLNHGGQLLAMKSRLAKEEINSINKAQWGFTMQQVYVPGLEAERHMVLLEPLEKS
jgi:16S rRNA (guanine527-N7)-methyltransferase